MLVSGANDHAEENHHFLDSGQGGDFRSYRMLVCSTSSQMGSLSWRLTAGLEPYSRHGLNPRGRCDGPSMWRNSEYPGHFLNAWRAAPAQEIRGIRTVSPCPQSYVSGLCNSDGGTWAVRIVGLDRSLRFGVVSLFAPDCRIRRGTGAGKAI